MHISRWAIIGAVLVAVGYYAFAINPTLYEVKQVGAITYRQNRLTKEWQYKKDGAWKETAHPPALIDPGRRLGQVGIEGFH